MYTSTYGNFTPAGKAAGMGSWKQMWADLWFMTAQGLTWYYEQGILKNCDTDREGFIVQVAEEFAAAYRMYHDEYGYSPWITDWDNLDIHAIINSADNGATGASAYDFAATAVNVVLDHPEYFYEHHLWEYEWDTTQTWMPPGQQGAEMQRLLVAVPGDGNDDDDDLQLKIMKLEAGTNKPLSGITSLF